jgi:hypothetical protein
VGDFFGGHFSFQHQTTTLSKKVRLVPPMQRENILYMTDTTVCIGVASFLADFYVLSGVIIRGICLNVTCALIAYSSDANSYITRKNPSKMKKHL